MKDEIEGLNKHLSDDKQIIATQKEKLKSKESQISNLKLDLEEKHEEVVAKK